MKNSKNNSLKNIKSTYSDSDDSSYSLKIKKILLKKKSKKIIYK